jgi:hypothetical protein
MEDQPSGQIEPPAETPAPEPSSTEEPATEPTPAKPHWRHLHRAKAWYGSHKKYSIPATIIILLVIVGGVPFTRYHAAGLVLKNSFTVQVTDSTANTPVSGATVSIGGVSGKTDGSGKVVLKSVKVGQHVAAITKKYYKDQTASLLVPILKQKTTPNILFIATGRQVKIKVTNLIDTKVLSDVQIQVADTTAKTGSDGTATVVLPSNANSQKATLSLDGYNDSAVTVKVSDKGIAENDFKLTPTGKIYFLSKRTGSVDVMKANLDGSTAETVVAGTGNEVDGNTFLQQSPDGKYVALVSKRTTTDATPQLYVLATADDKLLQADSGNAIFNMYGWIGDSLIYTIARQDLPAWQQGLNKLKSYDATSGKNTLLDQSAGSDAATGANESYQTVMLAGNDVVYGKTWGSNGNVSSLSGKQNSLQIIGSDGQNHQSVTTYPATDSVQFVQHGAVALYISDESADQTTTTYFDYTAGNAPKQISLSGNQLYAGSYLYFFSASGNQTFWSEPRDGKNALILADGSGANPKTITNLSDYSAYGWYTDNYLLATKGNSELYIMDTHGDPAIKITDFQPAYGGGY